MDKIKNKNYSVENLRNCYKDCSRGKFFFTLEYNSMDNLVSNEENKIDVNCGKKGLNSNEINHHDDDNSELKSLEPLIKLSTDNEDQNKNSKNELQRLSNNLIK
jgi:hypothetical protein